MLKQLLSNTLLMVLLNSFSWMPFNRTVKYPVPILYTLFCLVCIPHVQLTCPNYAFDYSDSLTIIHVVYIPQIENY